MDKRLSPKQIIIVTSTIFGLLFGSGNLIFPVHMGQLAGSNFVSATLGFIITGVGLPVLSIVAIAISNSNGLYSLSKKVSKRFAVFYSIVLYLTIGPLFVMPRSASISYNAGLSSVIGSNIGQDVAYLGFSLCFFIIVLFFSLKPSGITTWIGKIINPVFLAFLAILIIEVIIDPMGGLENVTPTEGYEAHPALNGFLQGYSTMDVLAGLAYGILIVDILKDMGVKSKKGLTKYIFIPSVLSALLIMTIYIITIIMGVESLAVFESSSNGSIALNQISNYYFGLQGNAVITIILTLASVKTSIGLASSCATTFNRLFPKFLNYKKWVVVFIFISFLISNIGLDLIIEVSTPVLNFLYPVSIVLILLAFSERWFDASSIVYKFTIFFTCIPAFFDFIASFPKGFIEALNIQWLQNFVISIFPFAEFGFGWVIPAILGFIIGIIVYKIRAKKVRNEKVTKN